MPSAYTIKLSARVKPRCSCECTKLPSTYTVNLLAWVKPRVSLICRQHTHWVLKFMNFRVGMYTGLHWLMKSMNFRVGQAQGLTDLPAFWVGSAMSCAHLSAQSWPSTFKIPDLL